VMKWNVSRGGIGHVIQQGRKQDGLEINPEMKFMFVSTPEGLYGSLFPYSYSSNFGPLSLVYHPGLLALDDLVIALQEEVLQPVHVQQHHVQLALA
jgi:hypothetical protein